MTTSRVEAASPEIHHHHQDRRYHSDLQTSTERIKHLSAGKVSQSQVFFLAIEIFL
jgi:hypothetical protein